MVHEMGLHCPKCRPGDPIAGMIDDGKRLTRSPNCQKCGGDGYLYRDPLLVRGLATSIRHEANPVDVGIMKPGDMKFSLTADFAGTCDTGGKRRISEDDKFIQTWDSPLDEGQQIIRAAATLGDNARLVPGSDPSEDRLWYQPHHALWCEDENDVVYKEGGDFILGPGRVIKWVGKQPRPGVSYTLKYTAYFEWLAWIAPQERYDRDNKDLGPLVFLRKRHIARINDSPFITANDRVPLGKRVAC